MWRCFAYLILSPAYLAAASFLFLGVRFASSLILVAPGDQIALALIGTGIVLTGSVRLIELLDD